MLLKTLSEQGKENKMKKFIVIIFFVVSATAFAQNYMHYWEKVKEYPYQRETICEWHCTGGDTHNEHSEITSGYGWCSHPSLRWPRSTSPYSFFIDNLLLYQGFIIEIILQYIAKGIYVINWLKNLGQHEKLLIIIEL